MNIYNLGFLCAFLIVNASALACQQLIVASEPEEPPSANWTITQYDFQYTEGNSTYKICGQSAYGITKSKLGMWLELTVENQPVTLDVSVKLNYTDNQNTTTSYYLTNTQYYDVGQSPLHLISVDNYRVGTYNVIEVIARRSS